MITYFVNNTLWSDFRNFHSFPPKIPPAEENLLKKWLCGNAHNSVSCKARALRLISNKRRKFEASFDSQRFLVVSKIQPELGGQS
jgi:hypothetical protein